MADLKCALDSCRKIFIEGAFFWRTLLSSAGVILTMVMALWVWSEAHYAAAEKIQDAKIDKIMQFADGLERMQAKDDLIINNQIMVISKVDTLRSDIKKLTRRY